MIKEITIEVDDQELLNALWYSDGSRIRQGLNLIDTPSSYEIISIERNGVSGKTLIRAQKKEPF